MLDLNMYFILLVDKRNPNWTKYSYLLKELLYRKNDYKIWIKGEPSWKKWNFPYSPFMENSIFFLMKASVVQTYPIALYG